LVAGRVAPDDMTQQTARFTFYNFDSYVGVNSQAMRSAGVRWCMRPETRGIWDKNELGAVIPENMATFERDLEPEYLALSSDGKKVYVALQENNAIAVFNLENNTFTHIKALAPKDWSATDMGLDASNDDDKINMQKWKIYGMLMPDTIDIYKAADGVEYIVTANEGDDKVLVQRPRGWRLTCSSCVAGLRPRHSMLCLAACLPCRVLRLQSNALAESVEHQRGQSTCPRRRLPTSSWPHACTQAHTLLSRAR